jgi:hypothetical protein
VDPRVIEELMGGALHRRALGRPTRSIIDHLVTAAAAERLGAERPGLSNSIGRNALMPDCSSGLLGRGLVRRLRSWLRTG